MSLSSHFSKADSSIGKFLRSFSAVSVVGMVMLGMSHTVEAQHHLAFYIGLQEYRDQWNRMQQEEQRQALAYASSVEKQAQAKIDENETRVEEGKAELKKIAEESLPVESQLASQLEKLQELQKLRDETKAAVLAEQSIDSDFGRAAQGLKEAEYQCAKVAGQIVGRSLTEGSPGEIRRSVLKDQRGKLRASAAWDAVCQDWKKAEKHLDFEADRLLSGNERLEKVRRAIEELQGSLASSKTKLAKSRKRSSYLNKKLSKMDSENEEAQEALELSREIMRQASPAPQTDERDRNGR